MENKNLHLAHIEDEILDGGYSGAKAAISYLESVADMISGHSDTQHMITVKWDGSPSLVCGQNPQNGKFFVGTKSVLNKNTPKLCYTHNDVDAMYKRQEGLATKLHAALEYLPKLKIKNHIFQGDLMFGPGDVKEQTIDGEQYITFQPNTIMYAVPAKSKLGRRIKKAKIGIIFHTAYKGDSIHNLHATFKISLSDLYNTTDVWFDDASYMDASGSVTMTAKETKHIQEQLTKANHTISSIPSSEFKLLASDKKYIAFLKQHHNHLIRQGTEIGDINNWINSFSEFSHGKIQKEKVKDDTKQRKTEQLHGHTAKVKHVLLKVLEFQKIIIDIKHILIRKLELAKKIGTFHVSEKGLTVVGPEGFVCVDHIGKAVKLVDRLKFSKANFNKHENEEMTAVTHAAPLNTDQSYMGGENGLAGKDDTTGSYLGKSTGQAFGSFGGLGGG